MTFRTESGSVYEMDVENQRVRRLNGPRDPTPRQGPDGEWRGYEKALLLETGKMLFVWRHDIVDGEAIARCTVTNRIVQEEIARA